MAMDVAPITESDWITPEEAALWLRVSKSTIERACKNHMLPAVQVEHTWRILRSELIARAKANVQQDNPELGKLLLNYNTESTNEEVRP